MNSGLKKLFLLLIIDSDFMKVFHLLKMVIQDQPSPDITFQQACFSKHFQFMAFSQTILKATLTKPTLTKSVFIH